MVSHTRTLLAALTLFCGCGSSTTIDAAATQEACPWSGRCLDLVEVDECSGWAVPCEGGAVRCIDTLEEEGVICPVSTEDTSIDEELESSDDSSSSNHDDAASSGDASSSGLDGAFGWTRSGMRSVSYIVGTCDRIEVITFTCDADTVGLELFHLPQPAGIATPELKSGGEATPAAARGSSVEGRGQFADVTGYTGCGNDVTVEDVVEVWTCSAL